MSRGDLEREALELNVPTASEPVPATDVVTCVHCERRIPRTDTDLVGLGYRCRACSDHAEISALKGESDAADHLVVADRAQFAARGRRIMLRAAAVFVFMVASSLVMLVFSPTPWAFKPLLAGFILVLAVGGRGYDQWRRFRVR